jgi:hypothetical protein
LTEFWVEKRSQRPMKQQPKKKKKLAFAGNITGEEKATWMEFWRSADGPP